MLGSNGEQEDGGPCLKTGFAGASSLHEDRLGLDILLAKLGTASARLSFPIKVERKLVQPACSTMQTWPVAPCRDSLISPKKTTRLGYVMESNFWMEHPHRHIATQFNPYSALWALSMSKLDANATCNPPRTSHLQHGTVLSPALPSANFATFPNPEDLLSQLLLKCPTLLRARPYGNVDQRAASSFTLDGTDVLAPTFAVGRSSSELVSASPPC